MPAHMGNNGTLIFFQISPDKGRYSRFMEWSKNCFARLATASLVFAISKQATGIFINPMNQSESG